MDETSHGHPIKAEDVTAKSYVPPPKNGPPGFPKAVRVKSKGRRQRWIDKDTGDILEWDYQHGRFEKYNKRGTHLGEYDVNGNRTKPSSPGRTITPSMLRKSEAKMKFYLAWYEKNGDGYVNETLLSGVDENEIKLEFNQPEYRGGCLEVTEKQRAWLEKRAEGFKCRRDLYDYFVEVFD